MKKSQLKQIIREEIHNLIDKKPVSVGDKVMISKTVGGGTGVVQDVKGGFVVVNINGKNKSYHLSDIEKK